MSNGVRQGGILSPFLLNVYMDDLSVNLKKCPTGYIAGGTVVNHLMYADDIVLLSPVGDWSFLSFACVWKIWIGS